MIKTLQQSSLRRWSLRYWSLQHGSLPILTLSALLTCLVLAPTLQADEHADEHVVVKKHVLRDCSTIRIGDGDDQLIVLGDSDRGFLGVELTNLTPELRDHFGVSGGGGVMISRVVEDSPASRAGLQVGDILTRIDNEEVSSSSSVGRMVRRKKSNEDAEIEFWRQGSIQTTVATLDSQEGCTVELGSYLENLKGLDLDKMMEDIDLEELTNVHFSVGQEALATAMETLQHVFEGQDWEEHFEGLKVLDLENIEERMEKVQERLEQLEREIEREQDRFERDLSREQSRHQERLERELRREQRHMKHKEERLAQDLARIESQAAREQKRVEREVERAQRRMVEAEEIAAEKAAEIEGGGMI